MICIATQQVVSNVGSQHRHRCESVLLDKPYLHLTLVRSVEITVRRKVGCFRYVCELFALILSEIVL